MRISGGGSGNVNVLQSDAGQFRNRDFITAQDGAFMCGLVLGGDSAVYSHIGMHNINGGGVTLLIDEIIITVASDMTIVLASYDTVLANNVGPWKCLHTSGAAGNSRLAWERSAGTLGTSYGELDVLAGRPLTVSFPTPLEVDDDDGFHVHGQTVNVGIGVIFKGREV